VGFGWGGVRACVCLVNPFRMSTRSGTVPALSREAVETHVAHAAEVAARRALQVTPSDSPVVNLLIHFKAQVDVLQTCGAFDDPSSVVGKELHEMGYESLSATIDAHIKEARKEEPKVDMSSYMASEELPGMLPYRFDPSMVRGDYAKVERLVQEAVDEVVQLLMDNPPEPGDVERVIAQESLLRGQSIATLQLDFLEATADASDEVLRKDGADGTDLGIWTFRYNDARMDYLVDKDVMYRMEGRRVDSANKKRPVTDSEPMFTPKKPRVQSSDSDSSMDTHATPAEDLQRLLEQQGIGGSSTWTPGGGFSGAGMLEEFKDATPIIGGGRMYDLLGVSRRYKFSGAHFMLSTVKYQMCMTRKKPLSALASIIPSVLALCACPWYWGAGALVATKVVEAIYNRSRGEKAAAGGVVASGAATSYYLQAQIAEGKKELNLLQACENAPPDLTWGDALGTISGRVPPKPLVERVMTCAERARKCTNDPVMQGKAVCKTVTAYIPNAEELTKKTYVIGGEEARKGTRFLFRLRKGATTMAPGVPETIASAEQAERAAELASRPSVPAILAALKAAADSIYGFHYRYRPDRARMYLYLNNPIRAPTTGYNRVALETQKQTRTLEALRLLNEKRSTNMPDIGFDPTMSRREWIEAESALWRRDLSAWKARCAGDWNKKNAEIIDIAHDVSTKYVQPMLTRREDLRKAFLVGEYKFYWLMQLLKVYPKIHDLEYALNGLMDKWRFSNNPTGPNTHNREQGNPQATLEDLVLNNKVGHDWYALRKLASAFSLHVRGALGTHPNPPSPVGLACLVTDMRNCVNPMARFPHPCHTSIETSGPHMNTLERLFYKYLHPDPNLLDGEDALRVKRRGLDRAWHSIRHGVAADLRSECDEQATRVQDAERGMVVRLFSQLARGLDNLSQGQGLYRPDPPKPPVPDGIPPQEPLVGNDRRLHDWLTSLPEWNEKLMDNAQPTLDELLALNSSIPDDCQEVRDQLSEQGRLPVFAPLVADGPGAAGPQVQASVVDEVYARVSALRL